jgi:hypothetical protein
MKKLVLVLGLMVGSLVANEIGTPIVNGNKVNIGNVLNVKKAPVKKELSEEEKMELEMQEMQREQEAAMAIEMEQRNSGK